MNRPLSTLNSIIFIAVSLIFISVSGQLITASAAGYFVSTGSMAVARESHTATLLQNGKVLISGGTNRGSVFDSSEIYDPATGKFNLSGTMISKRSAHTATLLGNGKILVAGGYGDPATQQATDSAEIYDPATGRFLSTTGKMNSPRYGHTATLLDDGRVLIAGGNASLGPAQLDTAEIYDPVSDSFELTGKLSKKKSGHTATLLKNGKVLIAGGTDYYSAFSNAELFDPKTGKFTSTGDLTQARWEHTAVLLQDGTVLLIGGIDNISTAEIYNPATESFSQISTDMTQAGSARKVILFSSGKALVTGGIFHAASWVAIDNAELYDPLTKTFSLIGTMNSPHAGHTCTLLNDGKMLLAGGWHGSNAETILSSAELYIPSQASVIQLPQTGQTKCYDSDGKVIPCAGTGQDGELQVGVASPNPRFVDNGDGTITDKLTGLIWLKNANCFGGKDWASALDSAFNLANGQCGLSDGSSSGRWRMPNINELESLLNLGQSNTATWLNSIGFSNTQPWSYWSSTTFAGFTRYAWYVGIGAITGNVGGYHGGDKTWSFGVLPVRGEGCVAGSVCIPKTGQQVQYGTNDDGTLQKGSNWPVPRFTDNGNGTVTDNLTGLIWTKDASASVAGVCSIGQKTWQEALAYVKCLNDTHYLNYSDWRLPNRKEINSLRDYSHSSPELPAGYPFSNVTSSGYWTSTSYTDDMSRAYGANLDFGYDNFGGCGAGTKQGASYAWPVRGGKSSDLSVSPKTADFGKVALGDIISRSIKVTNTSSSAVTPSTASLSGTATFDFTISDDCAGKILAPGTFCTITANFKPTSCGQRSALLTIPYGGSSVSASLMATACGTGNASLRGVITDTETKAPIVGATVTLGQLPPVVTGLKGEYEFSEVQPGLYSMAVSADGYLVWQREENLNPKQKAIMNMKLIKNTSSSLSVIAVTSKYSMGSKYYFLPGPGVKQLVEFMTTVNWGEGASGIIRYMTPHGTCDVSPGDSNKQCLSQDGTSLGLCSYSLTGVSATCVLDIYKTFEPCSTLKTVAISPSGFISQEKAADFMIMTNPYGIITPGVMATDFGNGFLYKTSDKLVFDFIDDWMEDDKSPIPENIPYLGKKGFSLRWIPSFEREVNSSGQAKFNVIAESIPQLEFTVLGNKVQFQVGVEFQSQFIEQSCTWKDVYNKVSILGEFGGESPPFYVPVSGAPIFVKGGYKVSAGGTANFKSFVPPELTGGELNAKLRIEGTSGVGVDHAASVTITVGVESDFDFQFPKNPNLLKNISITGDLSGALTILLYERKIQLYKGTWNLYGQKTMALRSQTGILTDLNNWNLIPRNYQFGLNPSVSSKIPSLLIQKFDPLTSDVYGTAISPVVTSTFPVSSSFLSSADSNVNLLWIADKPERSAVNRTMVVHSSFDGATWGQPVPIADDGTADFNPSSLTFNDGTVVAAWEDVKSTLSDTATLEEMVANLEISAAVFDPAGKKWGPMGRLSDNAVLDRSPKLAGIAKDNLILTWIRNAANDLNGSAANPNTLMYSQYNGESWSAPQIAAAIPFAIKRYSVVYDGKTANVILSLDTDGDPGTIDDLELYRLTYDDSVWGSLTRLTTDTIIDDNPQLSLDTARNVVLTWVKGNELTSAVNFDLANRTVIHQDRNYSSTLADFRMATATDGKVAITYADTSENNTSDLYGVFYDPIFKLWGKPKQLTDDPETDQRPAIAFLGTDTIIATYNRRLMINADGTPNTDTFTDLYMLKYTMGNDLALKTDSLMADPSNLAPGDPATLSVLVQNLGDQVAQNIPVSFYHGDPANGGKVIGSATVTDTLIPGDSRTVSIPWSLQTGSTPITVYAVVDPQSTIDVLNRANNTVSVTLALPNLVVQSISSEKSGPTRYTLIVTVANTGGTPSPATDLVIRNGSVSGPVIANLSVPALDRFASVDVVAEWDASTNPQPTYTVVANVDTTNSVPEYNKYDNILQTTLQGCSQSITVSPASLSYSAVAGLGNPASQDLTISTNGCGTLSWSASKTATWLALNPTAGTDSGVVNVSVEANGLTPDNYSDTITITASGAVNSPVSVPVTLLIKPSRQLTVALSGIGKGAVNSTPNDPINGIACDYPPQSGKCQTLQPTDASLTLNATVGSFSLFGGWGDSCFACGVVPSCLVSFESDKTCSALFTQLLPARIGTTYYHDVFEAYLTTQGDSLIETQATIFVGNLTLGKVGKITVKGGFDAEYTLRPGFTTLNGNLSIDKGSLVVDRVVIK